jgi:hypothetical protein
MLIVTTPKGKPSHLAVSEVGDRTDDAERCVRLKLWSSRGTSKGVRRLNITGLETV